MVMFRVKQALILSVMVLTLGSTAYAQLYGTTAGGTSSPSTLYFINPVTGSANEVGPVGFDRCSSLDARDGVLYAVCERPETNTQVLVRINHLTGVGTEIGPLNSCRNIFDMSFRGDGELFAIGWESPCASDEFQLLNINTGSGNASIFGKLIDYFGCTSGNGLAFSPDGTLYYSSTDCNASGIVGQIYLVNQSTGLASQISTVNFPFVGDSVRTNAIEFNPETGVMYASINSSNEGSFLGIINPNTGAVNIIGPTVDGLDAIAFLSGEFINPIPTLSEVGMMAAALALLVPGVLFFLRRRQSRTTS
jgi:hypothetical protein